MKILITGGAGFIGSNFIRYILRKYQDYQIVNLDKLTYAGNLDNLKDIGRDKRYTFVKGDIADEKIVDEIFEKAGRGDFWGDRSEQFRDKNDFGGGFDAVINFASETHVDRSITGPKEFIITEILGTYTLLEAIKKHKTPKYIQISTDEVYGSTLDGSFTEASPFQPNSPYSASKAGADHFCRAYYVTYGLPVIVTHSCNVYGPYQYPEKVIPLFITNLLMGKKVPLYGDGKNVREWIFTEDYCRAADVILHKGKPGEVYNIGSGHEIKNIELTRLILNELGAKEDMIEYVKDRLGHDRRYSIDFSKLRRELGWETQYSFEKGLKETVQWYKDNEWWWKKLIV